MSNEEMVEQIRSRSGDRQELLQALYDRNRGLIYLTVRPYISGGMEEQDAMQEGFLGLLEAVERYDPGRGSFTSCLCLWVRSVVGRWHDNTGDQKRIPVHMKDRIRKYKQTFRDYMTATGREPEDRILRAVLKISQEQLQDVRRTIKEMEPLSLSDPVPGVEDLTIGDCLPDPLVDVEQDSNEAVDNERDAVRIWEAVDNLPENRAEVIRLRYAEQRTMTATAEALGISRERVRQHEDKALRALKRNKTIMQIGRSRGYGSSVYHGGLSRFLLSGSSVVEETVLRRLSPQPEGQIMHNMRPD